MSQYLVTYKRLDRHDHQTTIVAAGDAERAEIVADTELYFAIGRLTQWHITQVVEIPQDQQMKAIGQPTLAL